MKNLLIVLFMIFFSSNVNAQDKEQKTMEIPESVQHEASVVIDGKTINYKVNAGYLTLKSEMGKEEANIFFIAYTKKGGNNPSTRPLTFSFNGGPGSSSVWLHLGALGPKRVLMTDEGEALPPPYELVDNEFTWLDETDLVFIDPVSTGYSRASKEEKAKDYHGFKADVASVGNFIHRYLSENKRWASPKFIIGESYGTTRASALSDHLINTYGMYLNGVILVSAITNFQTAIFNAGNDLPNVLFLPSYTATAWYHKKLNNRLQALSLEEVLVEAREFAETDYTLALMKGDQLDSNQRKTIIKEIAMYTGISETYIDRANLRLNIHKYTKEILRTDYSSVGRLDSRYIHDDLNPNGEYNDLDPSYQPTIHGPFSAMINDYLTRDLGFTTHLPYEILTSKVWPWDYKPFVNEFVNTSDDLKRAMHKNPEMKVWVANGYYDLATPFFATEYTMNHMGLNKKLKDNIIMSYYPAGHMMYLEKSSLIQMKEDAKTFYDTAIK